MYDVKIMGMRRVTFNDMRLEKQRWHLTIVIYQHTVRKRTQSAYIGVMQVSRLNNNASPRFSHLILLIDLLVTVSDQCIHHAL